MMTRMFTAAAIAALMAGSAMAQDSQPQGAEPELNPMQSANESTARAETGDAMMSADGRQLENDPGMAGQTTSQGAMSGSAGMAPAPMAGSTDTTGMAATGSAYGATGSTMGAGAMTTRTVTNGPVPDTAENRARYGQPMSRAGKRTTPAGN